MNSFIIRRRGAEKRGTPSREERVELVDYDLPSRRGILARKTASEFPELEARSR
jgi:hypothetical protein